MCEGASKQSPDLKNYTAPGPRPPVLKFLDPPLSTDCHTKHIAMIHGLWPSLNNSDCFTLCVRGFLRYFICRSCTLSYVFLMNGPITLRQILTQFPMWGENIYIIKLYMCTSEYIYAEMLWKR